MSISSSTGIGSGMDINGIVNQLVTAEGKPQLDAISKKESSTQTRLSGLGTLKSSLSTFQNVVQKFTDGSLFKSTQATSANEAVLKVSTSAGATLGTHDVKVNQLAKSQQSISTTEYTNSSAAITTGGTLNFSYPTGSSKTAFSVTIDSNNNTLTGIRDAINGDSSNNGITASIINVDSISSPGTTISKLVLTAKDSGTINSFSISVTSGDTELNKLDTSDPFNYSTTNAEDSVIEIDGQTATRPTNTITDVIQGVTLNLQASQLASDTAIKISVTPDNETIAKTIADFVTGYNNLQTTTKNLGKYGGGGSAANGPLIGDSTLRSISTALRQETTNTITGISGNYNSLAMIGITINKDGVMSLDNSKLTQALSSNPSSVSEIFSSTNGVANKLNSKLYEYQQSGGSIDSQQTSLGKQLKTLQKQRDAVQSRLDELQKNLQKQYIAMDLVVGQLKTTASFLTQKFQQ